MRCRDCHRLLLFWTLCYRCELARYDAWDERAKREEDALSTEFDGILARAREAGVSTSAPDVARQLDRVYFLVGTLKDRVAFEAAMKAWRV